MLPEKIQFPTFVCFCLGGEISHLSLSRFPPPPPLPESYIIPVSVRRNAFMSGPPPTRRRSASQVNADEIMNWRAQHGLDKRGDENTEDEYSDEEGEGDPYDTLIKRKESTLLVNGTKRKIRHRAFEALRHKFPHMDISEGVSSADGQIHFAVSGVNDVGDFLEEVSQRSADLEVRAVAGNGFQSNDEGYLSKQFVVELIYNPRDLIADMIEARNYNYKRLADVILMVAGLWGIKYFWGILSTYLDWTSAIPLFAAALATALWWAQYSRLARVTMASIVPVVGLRIAGII